MLNPPNYTTQTQHQTFTANISLSICAPCSVPACLTRRTTAALVSPLLANARVLHHVAHDTPPLGTCKRHCMRHLAPIYSQAWSVAKQPPTQRAVLRLYAWRCRPSLRIGHAAGAARADFWVQRSVLAAALPSGATALELVARCRVEVDVQLQAAATSNNCVVCHVNLLQAVRILTVRPESFRGCDVSLAW